jgi:hypothetical protein
VTPEGVFLRGIVSDPARASRTLAGAPRWRDDLTAFAKAVTEGAPGNGFTLAAAALSPDQWKAVHALLLRLSPGDDRIVTTTHWQREQGERKK